MDVVVHEVVVVVVVVVGHQVVVGDVQGHILIVYDALPEDEPALSGPRFCQVLAVPEHHAMHLRDRRGLLFLGSPYDM